MTINEKVAIATKSICAGAIYEHIKFYAKINRSKKQNYHNGYTWIYYTTTEYEEVFKGLFGRATINRAIAKLKEMGYIISKKGVTDVWDQTNWYRIVKTEEGTIIQPEKENEIEMIVQNKTEVERIEIRKDQPKQNRIKNDNTKELKTMTGATGEIYYLEDGEYKLENEIEDPKVKELIRNTVIANRG